jgi:hypothetical protein
MMKKIVFSLAALIVFAVLFTSCQNKVNAPIEKVVSFDTTISVPSCPVPILTNIYNCTTHKKTGEKVIGYDQVPDKLIRVQSSKVVSFDGTDASNGPVVIDNGGYDNGAPTADYIPVYHDYSNWWLLLFAALFIAFLMLFDYWLKNRNKTNTSSTTSTTEAVTARYTAINTQAMLDRIIANGGSIDHTITRDSETLSVKVNPPVVPKKVLAKPTVEEKKSDESAAK